MLDHLEQSNKHRNGPERTPPRTTGKVALVIAVPVLMILALLLGLCGCSTSPKVEAPKSAVETIERQKAIADKLDDVFDRIIELRKKGE